MATTRAILQVLENYQKARIIFVQTCAELATKPQVSSSILHLEPSHKQMQTQGKDFKSIKFEPLYYSSLKIFITGMKKKDCAA